MSDISNSTSSSNKRRLFQIDSTIEYLTEELNTLNDCMYRSEFECSLMTVKMKREKLRALSAVAKTQVLLTNVEVMLTESELNTDIERLRNFKRRKMNRDEGGSQVTTPIPPPVKAPPTTSNVSVQTTDSMSKKKKRSRRSSSRKAPGDVSSSDETIIVTTVQNTTLFGEKPQMLPTRFSPGLFTQTPANKSDSEISLSNSITSEFNKPYTKTLIETVKKSPAKKHKSEKKCDSKTKSKHATKHTQSPPGFPKTVTDLRKSSKSPPNVTDTSSRAAKSPKDSKTGDKKSPAPVRHNIDIFVSQPSTSTASPYLYVNSGSQYHSQKAGTSQSCNFYGSKP